MSARTLTVEIETPETVHASVTLFLDGDTEDTDAAAKRWMEYVAHQFADMRPADDVQGITVNIQWRRVVGREADHEEEEVA
jgi:hypothetical protein